MADAQGDVRAAMQAAARDRVAAAVAPVQAPIPDLLGLPASERRDAIAAKRGAGRPPGARNKRSEDVARWVVENVGDPLLVLVQLAVMPAEELAVAAGCSALEAIAEKRQAAVAVLPYLHRRMPQAVELDQRLPVLVLGDPRDYVAAQAAETIEVIQDLSEVPDAPV